MIDMGEADHYHNLEGHEESCYYCGKPCNSLAGSPSLWPIPLCHIEDPGMVKWHHTGCVSERLEQLRIVTALNSSFQIEADKLRKDRVELKASHGVYKKHLRIAYDAMRKIVSVYDNGINYDGIPNIYSEDVERLRYLLNLELPIERPWESEQERKIMAGYKEKS